MPRASPGQGAPGTRDCTGPEGRPADNVLWKTGVNYGVRATLWKALQTCRVRGAYTACDCDTLEACCLLCSGPTASRKFGGAIVAKVLVVDDDSEIRHLVKGVLDRAGYDVLEACDGRSAVEIAGADRPDLVLLDMSMPERDGVWVASEIRSRNGEDSPLMVALSARHQPSDRERALKAGCSLFLSKPCPPSRLRETIRTLLADKQGKVLGS